MATPNFDDNDKESLLDISLSDSNKKLWPLQWPSNQAPDFGGQEVTFKLHRDGKFCSLESSSATSMATPDFEDNDKESLLDISLLDSNKELWLLQWPSNQAPDFGGQEVTLKLHRDGKLGSFESSSGKSYEFVSFESQGPDATVFQSSAADTKIVGKISRRVSLIHYPEPSELDKSNFNRSGQFYQRSLGASSAGPSRRTLTIGSGREMYSSGVSDVTPHSSKKRSPLFETGGSSHPKKKQDSQVSQGSSGRDHSGVSLGSAGHSQRRKIKEGQA